MDIDVPQLVHDSWPFVGAAVGAYGTAVLTRVGDVSVDATVSAGQRILQRLGRREDTRPQLERAVRGAADAPQDEDAQGALRFEIRRLLEEDTELAAAVARMVPAPTTEGRYEASGERSVAVRHNSGVINTGDVRNGDVPPAGR